MNTTTNTAGNLSEALYNQGRKVEQKVEDAARQGANAAKNVAERAADKGEQLIDQAQDKVEHLADAAKTKVSQATDRVQEFADRFLKDGRVLPQAVRERCQLGMEQATSFIKAKPMSAALIAAGAGALLTMVMGSRRIRG